MRKTVLLLASMALTVLISSGPLNEAEGLMTLEELRAHLRDLDGRKAEAERELDALRRSAARQRT
jgi:hypothetical protein